jgi:hypothetical protein
MTFEEAQALELGHEGCGCSPRRTDCCGWGWECETDAALDINGDVDVVVCRTGMGCLQ